VPDDRFVCPLQTKKKKAAAKAPVTKPKKKKAAKAASPTMDNVVDGMNLEDPIVTIEDLEEAAGSEVETEEAPKTEAVAAAKEPEDKSEDKSTTAGPAAEEASTEHESEAEVPLSTQPAITKVIPASPLFGDAQAEAVPEVLVGAC